LAYFPVRTSIDIAVNTIAGLVFSAAFPLVLRRCYNTDRNGDANMQYREIKPGPAAARYIQCYWLLEDDSRADTAQRIVPDGRPELILNFARPFENCFREAWHAQPDCFFVGQITRPMLLRAKGPARTLGIRFLPHGASQFFGMPVRELTNSVVRVDDISKQIFRDLQRLRDSPFSSLAQPVLDAAFGAVGNASSNDPPISSAVHRFEHAGGQVSVKSAAEQTGLSVRQFERRFRDAVGIPPKLFCRMQRFQRVFRAIESSGADWVGAAVRCGYFDQAHLIRDFREFSGKTPTALLAQESDLARHFVRSPAMSHLSYTSATTSV